MDRLTDKNSKQHWLSFIIFLLSVIGMIISTMLLSQHYGGILFCSKGGGCHDVAVSSYSSIGTIPLALIGMWYFLSMAILSFDFGFWKKHDSVKNYPLLLAFSVLALLADFWLFVIMVFIVESFCYLCFLTYLLNVGIVFLSWQGLSKENPFSQLKKNVSIWLGSNKSVYISWGIFFIFVVGSLFLNNHFAHSQKITVNEKISESEWKKFLTEYENLPTVALTNPNDYGNVMGTIDAPLVVFEYSDYMCPFCKQAAQYNHQIVQAFGKDVAVVHKNFPLDITCNASMQRQLHEGACLLAQANICAGKQGYFWQMYSLIFANQERWNNFGVRSQDVSQMADVLKKQDNAFDKKKLETCLAGDESKNILQQEIELANELEVHSTPTLFFNGKKVGRFLSYGLIERLIAYEKNKK